MSKASMMRLVAGLGASTRQKMVRLRESPGIKDAEGRMVERGILWSAAFETQCNQISLKLFGIIMADTKPDEPHLEQSLKKGRSAWQSVTDEEFAAHHMAKAAWAETTNAMDEYETLARKVGRGAFWRSRGIDVTDQDGFTLACLPLFERQMYAAYKGLLGARLTLDGAGRRAPQSVEQWGKALEAEAAKFRSRR